MSLTSKQKREIEDLIDRALDLAEYNWDKVGSMMMKASFEHLTEDHAMPSLIPNHPWVSDGVPKVAPFIALVVDMRGSTSHMHTEIDAKVSGFNRVYYETSALLPALAKVISYEGGSVTEFLGDGVLALFDASGEIESNVKAAYRAANNCIDDMRTLVNAALMDRYALPALNLGAGMAFGQAMVTIVGTITHRQPKVLGKCVYEAAKLAGATNAVLVSTALRKTWPRSEGGHLQFVRKEQKGVEGFRIQRKQSH